MNRPLLLASKSPRRAQLLREAGFQFQVIEIDVDESFPPTMPAREVPAMLAQRKAKAAAHLIENQEIILTADSVVILDDEVFNKPEDRADAVRMIRRMSGRKHTVVTGVCLLAREREVVFSGVTDVTFADLTDAEIDYYIDTCRPFDKAGAYGVQEWIGHCKIARIEGTYTNVMGLPVDLVYAELQKFA